jgi:hypothetical protein
MKNSVCWHYHSVKIIDLKLKNTSPTPRYIRRDCPFSVCFQDENNQYKKYFKFEFFIADSHADFRDLFILCRTV